MHKEKLLIAHGNPYIFDGVMVPVIPRLSMHFDITLILVDFFFPPKLYDTLNSWTELKIIKNYLIVPDYEHFFQVHYFMSSKVKLLKNEKFSIVVLASAMQVWERYIIDCVLAPECMKLVYLSTPFSIFERKGGQLTIKSINHSDVQQNSIFTRVWRMFLKEKSSGSIFRASFYLVKRVQGWLLEKVVKILSTLRFVMDRYVLPLLFVGKIFPFAQNDRVTDLGTDQFDGIIAVDEGSYEYLKVIYPDSRHFLIRNTIFGQCRCGQVKPTSNKILAILPGFSYDVSLFLRDLLTVMNESGAKKVDLRPHPRQKDLNKLNQEWLKYVQDSGIEAELVDPEVPIREVACDYLGVVGALSAALRDARAACRHIFVIGFTIGDKFRGENPQAIFGYGEGINWIEFDGSFEPGIFKTKANIPPDRIDLPTLLRQLIDPSKNGSS